MSEIDPEAARNFGEEVDFGVTAKDYSTHRAGFPPAFFEALVDRGVVSTGRALDIGTGVGTVARGLALAGMGVDGLDPATELMEQAAKLDAKASVSVQYQQGNAESLPFEEGVFSLVTAGQCWHWFDRPKAAGEISRVLRDGGYAVIAHFDWLPIKNNVVARTESLIEKHNPSWVMGGGSGLYPAWLKDLAEAGFVGIETFSFDVAQPYTPDAWRGRIRASAGISASLSEKQVGIFDEELEAMLREEFPTAVLSIPHRVWAVVAKKLN